MTQDIFHNRPILLLADDDANRWVLMWELLLVVKHIEVEFHLALVLRLKLAHFELNGHQSLHTAAVEQQIDELFMPIDLEPILIAYE